MFVDSFFQDDDSQAGVGKMLVEEKNQLQVTPIEENIGLPIEEANLGEEVNNIIAKGKVEAGIDTYHFS